MNSLKLHFIFWLSLSLGGCAAAQPESARFVREQHLNSTIALLASKQHRPEKLSATCYRMLELAEGKPQDALATARHILELD